jgi:Flp pilus assembly protein TadG
VVVEFAICAPLLFMIFFAALEFSRVNMIRQSVENAVYEGSRRGIVPGATAADCMAAAQSVLNSISARDAEMEVDPETITADTPEVTVSIAVPVNSNTWVTPFFFANRTVTGSMTMRRERYNALSVP